MAGLSRTPTRASRRPPRTTPHSVPLHKVALRSLINEPNPYMLQGRMTWNWAQPRRGLPDSKLKQTTGYDFTWPQGSSYDSNRPPFMPDEQLLSVDPENELLAPNGLPQLASVQQYGQSADSQLNTPFESSSAMFEFDQPEPSPSPAVLPRYTGGVHPASTTTRPRSCTRISAGQTSLAQSQTHSSIFNQEMGPTTTYAGQVPFSGAFDFDSILDFNGGIDFNTGFDFNKFNTEPMVPSFHTTSPYALQMLSAPFQGGDPQPSRRMPANSRQTYGTNQTLPNTPRIPYRQKTLDRFSGAGEQDNTISMNSEPSRANKNLLGPIIESHQGRIATVADVDNQMGASTGSNDLDFDFTPSPSHHTDDHLNQNIDFNINEACDSNSNFHYEHRIPIDGTPFFMEQGDDVAPFANDYPIDPAVLSNALTHAAYGSRVELPSAMEISTRCTPTFSSELGSSAALTRFSTLTSNEASTSTAVTTPFAETPSECAPPLLGGHGEIGWDNMFEADRSLTVNDEKVDFFRELNENLDGNQKNAPWNQYSEDDWLV